MGTNDRMAAGDAPGMREDDAVSFSGDEDGDGSMDAGCIDAEDVSALLDEREAAAPDEPLSLATIARRNLPDDFLELAEPEAIARAVAKLDQVRLDRCRLASFVGGVSVEVRRASFANVTALYLQHNRLTSTRGVDGETLPRLRFLALQGNRLRAVAELGTLRHLALLDLSENPNLSRLDELVSAMPSSMRFLSCAGCGCAADGDYRAALVASLPRLKKLDGVDVTGRERDDAMAAFGEDEDEDEGEREGEGEDEGNRGDQTRLSGGGARRERRSAAKAVRFLREERVDGRVVVLRRRRSISRDTSHAPDARGPRDARRRDGSRGEVAGAGRGWGDGRSRRRRSIQREKRAGDARRRRRLDDGGEGQGGATEAGRVDYRGGDDDAVRRVRGTGGTVEVLYLAS